MRVTVLYDAIEDKEKADAEAKGIKMPLVYEQVAEVLTRGGHQVSLLAAEKKPRSLVTQIEKDDSDILFNLCESLGGVSQHEQNVASLLELLDKPFTGSGSMGLSLAQDKALSKKLFSFHGIRYPKFSTMDFGQVDWSDELKFPLFLKPLNEDASIGIDYNSVVHNLKELMERISYIHTEVGSAVLIEEYIEGREIYVGVLGNDKPEALPIIEWDFSKLSKDTPRIASSEAKWDKDSEAYHAPEIFPEDIPEPVYEKIQETAITAYKALKLRDYGRIDMRLTRVVEPPGKDEQEDGKAASPKKKAQDTGKDKNGTDDLDRWQFYIIEVNPNPFLDKKAELATAARKHGLKYPQLIEHILDLALKRSKR